MAKSIYGECKNDWTADDVMELQRLIARLDVRSLDCPLGTNDDGESLSSLGDLVMDNRPGPEEIAEENELREILVRFIDNLPPRECLIVKMRFGFYDGEPKTLDQIGAHFGVTRERIRQVEMKALRKLRWNIMVKGRHHSIEDF